MYLRRGQHFHEVTYVLLIVTNIVDWLYVCAPSHPADLQSWPISLDRSPPLPQPNPAPLTRNLRIDRP
jgi:hypothetical protein